MLKIKYSLIGIILISLISCEANTQVRKKYREESYILNDGTPCIIIHGGTHSGMVGVTCNYKEIK